MTPTRLVSLLSAFTALLPLDAQDSQTPLPSASMILPESALPDYEADIDHAALIRQNDRKVVQQGRKIYEQVCHNCHGDINLPGSIPNSLRFASGEFQHGSDPYTLYQTITRGWRLMTPQTQLVPSDKYAVIHYIRDHYLKDLNPDQYFEVTDAYLSGLPKGSSTGPEPVVLEPWRVMDYGPFLIGTFEIATETQRAKPWPDGAFPDYLEFDANLAYKGIATRLDSGSGGVSQGKVWTVFEHDTLRLAGAWSGERFIDWHGINFDGKHVARPRTIGEPLFQSSDAPGWANPATGSFEDPRFKGLDGRRYGPLPKEWGHFKGLYRHGERVVIAYTIGDANILESHQSASDQAIVRVLNIGKSSRDLTLRLANAGVSARVVGSSEVAIQTANGFTTATIPSIATPLKLAFVIGNAHAAPSPRDLDLARFTRGGPAQYSQTLEAPIIRGSQDGPFQWDSYALPRDNPWKSWLRITGVEFTPDGKSALLSTWDGDVWSVEGIDDENAVTATWRRIAAGLFQPLGIKRLGGDVFVSCRNQIVRLRDLNADGETDFYENFNSDHQVTNHFHEFAMGLQADKEGNLYYAKSARHARVPLVAQHGTLLKVSKDGSSTEILAKGFRAANGVCINPDGSFFVTDQEGHWNPMNRINWIQPGNRFYGNMWGYGAPDDSSDSAMEPPLAWVDKGFDRSPSELLWVDSEKWGALNGSLLNLSYGHGRMEIIPHERVKGQLQGGLCRLPIPDFPTGTMRGRFHPGNGHLYLCGMSAWGTNQLQLPGGFYRVRATGKPAHLPVGLKAREDGIDIVFSDPLAPDSIRSIQEQIKIRTWALKRSANYGSKHYDERSHTVTKASISRDGSTLSLKVADMNPVWQMSIQYDLIGANGASVKGEIQNTIHNLAP